MALILMTPNLDFNEKLKRLPFVLNIVDVLLNKEQQVKFLNIITKLLSFICQ